MLSRLSRHSNARFLVCHFPTSGLQSKVLRFKWRWNSATFQETALQISNVTSEGKRTSGKIDDVPSESVLGTEVNVNDFSCEWKRAQAHVERFTDLPQEVLHCPERRWLSTAKRSRLRPRRSRVFSSTRTNDMVEGPWTRNHE